MVHASNAQLVKLQQAGNQFAVRLDAAPVKDHSASLASSITHLTTAVAFLASTVLTPKEEMRLNVLIALQAVPSVIALGALLALLASQ